MAVRNPIRVLHVHSDLHWGGVEQWLLQVSRSIDRSSFQFDFFAASADPVWQSAIESMGLGSIASPRPRQLVRYAMSLRRTLHQRPRYDVIHSHFLDHSGLLLREAARAGVPLRIAHSHVDTAPIFPTMGIPWRAYFRIQNRLLRRYATRGIAASSAAAASMFGHEWKTDRRWSVLHYGIDLDPFNRPAQHIRSELGFRSEDIIFGHVGRFVEQKNHRFLVDVVERLIRLVPRAKFLWIGEGHLQPTIEERLRALGIRDRVTILSRCSNVPALMRGAMDAFLFPSKYEGLGIAVVEAQAAGLPCFLADRVPTDADVVHPLVQRLSLLESPEHWASTIARTVQQNRPVSAREALEAVRRSSFNMESSVRRLEELYRERL